MRAGRWPRRVGSQDLMISSESKPSGISVLGTEVAFDSLTGTGECRDPGLKRDFQSPQNLAVRTTEPDHGVPKVRHDTEAARHSHNEDEAASWHTPTFSPEP